MALSGESQIPVFTQNKHGASDEQSINDLLLKGGESPGYQPWIE
jgi:hypothetical protein